MATTPTKESGGSERGSIRTALARSILFTTLVALVLAAGSFATMELVRARRAMPRNAAVLGDVVGLSSRAALLFMDPAPAQDALDALSAEPAVRAAAVFDADGAEFARYESRGAQGVRLDALLQRVGHRFADGHLDVFRQIDSEGETVGWVWVRYDTAEWTRRLWQYALTIACVMALASAIALLVAGRMRARISTPLEALASGASSLAEGDLSVHVPVESDDEIGRLAGAFNGMAGSLRTLVGQLRDDTRDVNEIASSLEQTSRGLADAGVRQGSAVEQSAASIENVHRSVNEVGSSAASLSETAQEASSSVIELDSSIADVAGHMDHLSETIEGSASSVNQLVAAIGEITRNAEALDEATGDSARSLSELATSVEQVAANATRSQDLSTRAQEAADRGDAAVTETVSGMDEIRVSFRGLEQNVSQLGQSSQSIGEVVKVIEDVVRQTNLLALNASIIAAQAGEHGKAFAVVAEEVQSLADTTAQSTREIENMIRGVQKDMRGAMDAALHGAERVDRGVQLASSAGEALRAIAESSRDSSEMVRQIADSTTHQRSDIERLSQSMSRVKQMAEQIAGAATEQHNASAEINRGVDRIRAVGQHVVQATQEQAKQSRVLTGTVEEVATRMTQVAEATAEQRKGSEEIQRAIEVFREVTEESSQRAIETRQIVETLASRSRTLEHEIERFRT